jgi:hypothetical protein
VWGLVEANTANAYVYLDHHPNLALVNTHFAMRALKIAIKKE